MMKTTLTITLVMIACCMTASQGIAGEIGSNSYYQLQGPITYEGGILTNLTMRPSPGSQTTVKPSDGDFHVDSFFDVFTEVNLPGDTFAVDSFFDITYQIDLGGGGQYHVDSFFDVFTELRVTPPPSGDATDAWDCEMVSLSLSGNVGTTPVELRTCIDKASPGLMKITDLGGQEFAIDSFFDIYTELSVDGGPFYVGTKGRVQLIPDTVGQIYDIRKNQQLYGNLDQDDIPNGGQFMCGPTAAVNSFIYLQNKYPGTFDNHLVPVGASNGQDLDGDGIAGDSYDDMIAVAMTLGLPQHMNTKFGAAGGTAGTWDDMFIHGKQAYIESVLPGVTIYGAEMNGIWAGPRIPPRPADEVPPLPKPGWVQHGINPTWQFLYDELVACEDVEILIVDDSWGHFLTVTGFTWNDANLDGVVDPVEGAVIHYIDPVTGLPGISAIRQNGPGQQLLISYGVFPSAQLIMTVKESVPEPATMSLLTLGGLVLLRRRRRGA